MSETEAQAAAAANREKDARIAVELFPEEWGWFLLTKEATGPDTFGPAGLRRRSDLNLECWAEVPAPEVFNVRMMDRETPRYTTDPAAMMAIIDRLRDNGTHIEIFPISINIPDGSVGCHVAGQYKVTIQYHFFAFSKSLPEAVANAAIAFLDWKKGQGENR